MTPIRKRLALGLLVALSGSILAVWHGGQAHASLVGSGSGRVAPRSMQDSRSAPALTEKDAFKIAGSVGGLYPGLTKALRLTVTNPQHFAIVVTSVTVTVHVAGPGCAAGNIIVKPFSGSLRVGARASARVRLKITLAHRAPNACQGAVFPLRYHGLAVKR